MLYYYKLISKNEQISEEILSNLSDLDTILPEENEKIDINEPFHMAEIKKLELPSDFVEAVYCLTEKEFWDCYRYNTFKPFERRSLLKKYSNIKNEIPRILRVYGGYNYKNTIYKNRYHLLYIERIELLPNLLFINTKESLKIIQKYKDILQIMEQIDQLNDEDIKEYTDTKEDTDLKEKEDTDLKEKEDTDLKEKEDTKEDTKEESRKEEKITNKLFRISHGLKY